ncbi:MFS transporter [Nocardia jinanensis]|uniref:MFS transporter n=1 Tax=Nocardia jinanensis TaxID=382504 RepID=A0A917RP42_9NOCA|nr:MFS transporter [Nocardia jinanensis]GGL17702.1 hypothetical protein GCM10011588_35540 [Nocardia jinanensis]
MTVRTAGDEQAPAALRFFLFATLVSGFGTALMPSIIAYTTLDSSDNSQRWFAVVFLVGQVVPFFVTLMLAGYLDRAELYSTSLAVQCALAAACFGYAAVSDFYRSTIALAIGLQVILTGLGAVAGPALTRSLAVISPGERWLNEAARKTTLYRSISQLLGQGISGLLLAGLGAGLVVTINGVTFLVMSMAIIWNRNRYREHRDQIDEGADASPRGGIFRPLRSRRSYQLVLSYQLITNILVVHPYLILTPVALGHHLGVSAAVTRWGALGAAFGLGAIAGAMIVEKLEIENRLSVSVASGILEIPILIVLAWNPTSLLLVPMAVISGFQSTFARVLFSQQMFTDFRQDEIGRVSSLTGLTWIGSTAVVSALATVLGAGHSRTLFSVLTVSSVLATATFWYAVMRNERSEAIHDRSGDAL